MIASQTQIDRCRSLANERSSAVPYSSKRDECLNVNEFASLEHARSDRALSDRSQCIFRASNWQIVQILANPDVVR